MDVRAKIAELLRADGSTALAFGPLASGGAEMPPDLGVPPEQVVSADVPLDLLEPTSQAAAVIAFEYATRHGHGTAIVHPLGSTEPYQLHLFDLTLEYGVIVSVMTPSEEHLAGSPDPATLAPRRATFQLNVTGVIASIDPSFSDLLGWLDHEVVGETALEFIHPDDHEAGLVGWADLLGAPGNMVRSRQRYRRSDGSWLWCEATSWNRSNDSGAAVACELIDVSREVAAQASLQRRETMLDRLYRALPTSVLVLEADGSVAVVNDRWSTFLGGHDLGPYHALLSRVDEPDRVVGAIERSISTLSDAELSIDLDDGTCRHGDLHISPLVERGVHVGLLLTLDDTTAQRHHEEELANQMRRDVLTGALNRLGIREQIEQRLAGGGDLSVLYLDVDHFKVINDRHGHAAGDAVLRAVADGCRRAIRGDDLVGRTGGDEFLLLVEAVGPAALGLAARVEAYVCEATVAAGLDVDLRVSIGVAEQIEGDDFDAIVDRADRAMYEQKMIDRNHHQQHREAAVSPLPSLVSGA